MSLKVEAENALPNSLLRSGEDWFNKLLSGFAAFATLAMMLHVTINAATRTFLNSPLHGTLEYTQFWYLPTIAFIGIVTAQRSKEHIEARLLFDYLPFRARPFVQAATDLLMLILAVLIAVYSLQMALESLEIGRTAGVSGVVIWPATFSVPIAMSMFTLWIAIDLVNSLRHAFDSSASDETSTKEA